MKRRRKPITHETTATDPSLASELEADEGQNAHGLTTMQAAQKLGRSPAWVKNYAHLLGAKLTRRGYRFPADITIERTEKLSIGARPRVNGSHPSKDLRDGDTAARVFAELDKGTPTREIVQRLMVPPEKVRALAREWIECGRFDASELAVIHGQKDPPPPPKPLEPLPSPRTVMPEVPTTFDLPEEPPPAPGRSRIADMIADARREAEREVASFLEEEESRV